MKTILLIDDDTAVLDLLGSKLRPAYAVIASANPHQAVKLAVDRRPDLVLCDVDMPGMNGAEVAAALKDAGAGAIPIVYLTGLVSPQEANDLPLAAAGRHRVIAKRAALGELLACIKSLIGD